MSKEEIRKQKELEYRNHLYQEIHFPFLHSLNIKNIFQGFEHNGEFIGVLYLKWSATPEPFYWYSEWINSPIEAIMKAQEIQKENDLYVEDKLVFANLNHIQNKVQNRMDLIQNKTMFENILN